MTPFYKEAWEYYVDRLTKLQTLAREFQESSDLDFSEKELWDEKIREIGRMLSKAIKMAKEAPSALDEMKKERSALNRPKDIL